MPSVNANASANSKKKTNYTATIAGCCDDGTNYFVDISVDLGGVRLGYFVVTPMTSFTDVSSCQTWLESWITPNKASFNDTSQDGLFVGVSATA